MLRRALRLWRGRHLANVVVIAGLLAAVLCLHECACAGSDLLVNPGFENALANWSVSGTQCSFDNTQFHSGTGCLRITNDDTSSVQWAVNTTLALSPVREYNISVWVKTSITNNASGGALVRVTWLDDNKIQLGYKSSAYVTATQPWTEVSFKVRLPRDAVYTKLTFSLEKCTGTAWFDDISISAPDVPESRVLLKSPGYRNSMYSGNGQDVILGMELLGSASYPLSDLRIKADIPGSHEAVVSDIQQKQWNSIGLQCSKLAAGDYQLNVHLIDKAANRELSTNQVPITIYASGSKPIVYIDEQNRCVVNGESFFPLGLYADAVTAADLDRMMQAGFNCVIDYSILGNSLSQMKTYLDMFTARDMKVIFSLKDCYDSLGSKTTVDKYGPWTGSMNVLKGLVSTFKSHNAILAWYLSDENAEEYFPQMAERYSWLKSNDFDHPVWQIIWSGQDLCSRICMTDVVGIDVYPVWQGFTSKLAYPHLDQIGKETKRAWGDVMGSRAIWMVPECSSFKSLTPGAPTPTYSQMMCLAYLCLINGARGLVFYSYSRVMRDDGETQWTEVSRLGKSLCQIKPIVLGADVPPLSQIDVNNCGVVALTRRVGNDYWIIAANASQDNANAVYSIPDGVGSISKAEVGPEGSVERSIDVSDRTYADQIEPWGTRVYHLVR